VRGQREMKRWKFDAAHEMRRRPTPAERQLWEALKGRQLRGLRFRRQAPLFGYIADFYCPAASLVIEVDGEIHADQKQYDQQRDRNLADRGYSVLRFTNQQVTDELPRVLEVIAGSVPLPEQGQAA
jgi:very-short-patch-repair endonuclease